MPLKPLAGRARQLRFAANLLTSRLHLPDDSCPYCLSGSAALVGRKFLMLEVRRCDNCGLMYRWPKSSPHHAAAYYDCEYSGFEGGLVTYLPKVDELSSAAQANFAGTRWDSTERLSIISQVGPRGRLLDYGCSWGYFTYQARAAGYGAVGYEISQPRAAFGRLQLGLDIKDNPVQLDLLADGSFDLIYSSHVLEHLPSLVGLFDQFNRLLTMGGRLVVFVPNCGGRQATAQGLGWGPFANQAHTLSLDAAFFRKNLPTHGFSARCVSEPYGSLVVDADWSEHGDEPGGDELLVVATKIRASGAYPGDRGHRY